MKIKVRFKKKLNSKTEKSEREKNKKKENFQRTGFKPREGSMIRNNGTICKGGFDKQTKSIPIP
jgi:hypothetical protein